MSEVQIRAGIVAYITGAIMTFGPAAVTAECKPYAPAECEGVTALIGAATWPLWWSWTIAEWALEGEA